MEKVFDWRRPCKKKLTGSHYEQILDIPDMSFSNLMAHTTYDMARRLLEVRERQMMAEHARFMAIALYGESEELPNE